MQRTPGYGPTNRSRRVKPMGGPAGRGRGRGVENWDRYSFDQYYDDFDFSHSSVKLTATLQIFSSRSRTMLNTSVNMVCTPESSAVLVSVCVGRSCAARAPLACASTAKSHASDRHSSPLNLSLLVSARHPVLSDPYISSAIAVSLLFSSFFSSSPSGSSVEACRSWT